MFSTSRTKIRGETWFSVFQISYSDIDSDWNYSDSDSIGHPCLFHRLYFSLENISKLLSRFWSFLIKPLFNFLSSFGYVVQVQYNLWRIKMYLSNSYTVDSVYLYQVPTFSHILIAYDLFIFFPKVDKLIRRYINVCSWNLKKVTLF